MHNKVIFNYCTIRDYLQECVGLASANNTDSNELSKTFCITCIKFSACYFLYTTSTIIIGSIFFCIKRETEKKKGEYNFSGKLNNADNEQIKMLSL